MNKRINILNRCLLLLICLPTVVSVLAAGDANAGKDSAGGDSTGGDTAGGDSGFVVIQKEETGLDASAGDRIKTFLLHGDPTKEGLYIMRIRFPAGQASRPHYHDQDRFITVIEGTWYAGTQEEFDMDKTVAIKAGGFMKHPAGAAHFDGAKDEAVVVEIRGMGPVKTSSVK